MRFGQTYFTIQTRRQEVADYFNQLDEDNKRLVIRGDIKQWNQMLVEAAHNAGVITNEEYAEFQNAGYMGLYGGLTVDEIHKRKNLKEKDKILDFMGSTELIANLFRISQTEEKLKKDNIKNADKATSAHYEVGAKVRQAIKDIGGTMPEDLPTPEKSIKEIEKEQLQRLKKKKGKLMLDEWHSQILIKIENKTCILTNPMLNSIYRELNYETNLKCTLDFSQTDA